MLQAAPPVVRGALQEERLDALRGKLLERRRMAAEAEELEQAEGSVAVTAQIQCGKASHSPEELKIGTDEDFAATRIYNLQPVAMSEVRGHGAHER